MAIYAGVKIPRDYEYPANLTLKEREDHHKNLLDYDDDYNIDVPPHLDDIVVYRASLGHKVISYYHSKTGQAKTNSLYCGVNCCS